MAHDAVVIGAGPNGLAAAIELPRAGCSVPVIEARQMFMSGVSDAWHRQVVVGKDRSPATI